MVTLQSVADLVDQAGHVSTMGGQIRSRFLPHLQPTSLPWKQWRSNSETVKPKCCSYKNAFNFRGLCFTTRGSARLKSLDPPSAWAAALIMPHPSFCVRHCLRGTCRLTYNARIKEVGQWVSVVTFPNVDRLSEFISVVISRLVLGYMAVGCGGGESI